MRHSLPDSPTSNTSRPISRYLVLAGGLHLLVLGIPLQLQTLSAETPTQIALHAMLQTSSPAKTVQTTPVTTQTVPTEKKPARIVPSSKPAKQIISRQLDAPSAPQIVSTAAQVAVPSVQDSTVIPTRNVTVEKQIPPRFDAAYLNNPHPNYPFTSRRLNESGKVLLKVKVSEDGRPIAVDIAQSSHSKRLDQAALQAVSQWHFIPAKLGEQAIAADVIVPIVFKLED